MRVQWAVNDFHDATVLQMRSERGMNNRVVQRIKVLYDDGQILSHEPFAFSHVVTVLEQRSKSCVGL